LKEKKNILEIIFTGAKIKNKAIKVLGKDVKVLVFGSIVKENWTLNSYIDILIISKNLNKNWFKNTPIKLKIKKAIGLFSPFQIHLATPEEYENWYKKFIKKDYIEVYNIKTIDILYFYPQFPLDKQ
jgi:uncharacterized protein